MAVTRIKSNTTTPVLEDPGSAVWSKEEIWNKEVDIDIKWIEFVDDNVLAKLPAGTEVKDISAYGASYWTRTAAIETVQSDGSEISYFLKVTHTNAGKQMVHGEFEGQKALYEAVPGLVPVPVGWGTYASDPNIHFFICSFVEMNDDIPDPRKLGSMLAEVHRKAVSPNGKYGFHTTTGVAAVPQKVDWKDTWEQFFLELLKATLDVEEKSQGPDPEMTRLKEAIFEKVVPRLLRPLETGGRSIQPRLVHGDLWDGNTSTDVATDLPVIFDSTCLYAHNEYELAPWRPPRHKIGKPYIRAYTKYFPISTPVEDFDDRVLLYCVKFNALSSALYPGNLRFRHVLMDDMRALVDKYPGGYEEWAKMNNGGE